MYYAVHTFKGDDPKIATAQTQERVDWGLAVSGENSETRSIIAFVGT